MVDEGEFGGMWQFLARAHSSWRGQVHDIVSPANDSMAAAFAAAFAYHTRGITRLPPRASLMWVGVLAGVGWMAIPSRER
jgi:hypothetical protein